MATHRPPYSLDHPRVLSLRCQPFPWWSVLRGWAPVSWRHCDGTESSSGGCSNLPTSPECHVYSNKTHAVSWRKLTLKCVWSGSGHSLPRTLWKTWWYHICLFWGRRPTKYFGRSPALHHWSWPDKEIPSNHKTTRHFKSKLISCSYPSSVSVKCSNCLDLSSQGMITLLFK